MSTPTTADDAHGLRQIDAIATRYEATRGQFGLHIEAALESVPEHLRMELFGELMKIEREFRDAAPLGLKQGFPNYAALVDVAFAESKGVSPPRALIQSHANGLPLAPEGYEFIRLLGRGGMGVVYLAKQLAVRREVAIKQVADGDREHGRRLQFEAQAIAQLRHDNIVQVHEAIEHNNASFLVMEHISGGTLADRLAGGQLEPIEAARLVEQIAEGVQAAHAKGLVHRDLKPTNVLMQGSTPKIVDFGLAKSMDADSSLADNQTRTGMIVGTPAYMAPEQASGKVSAIGPATDIYALGAILFELLVGRPPFQAATVVELLRRVCEEEPSTIRSLRRGVPRDLEVICQTCLHKEPARRYASAAALARDLRCFSAGEPIAARPAGFAERSLRWARRRPAQAALLVVSIAAILAGAVGAAYHVNRLGLALHQETEARAREQLASQAARTRLDLALDAQRALLREVEQLNNDDPTQRNIRQRMTQVALKGLDAFAIRNQTLDADFYAAVACFQTGEMFQRLGKLDDAQQQFSRAIAICHDLKSGGANSDNFSATWANALLRRGNIASLANDADNVEADAREAIRIADAWRAAGSSDARLPKLRIDALTLLAHSLTMSHRTAEAQPVLDELCALVQENLKNNPKNVEGRLRLGMQLDQMRQHAEAKKDYGRALKLTLELLDIARQLADDVGGELGYRRNLAATLGDLGRLMNANNRPADARPYLVEAEAIARDLMARDPDAVQYRCDWAMANAALGDHDQHSGRPDLARERYQASRDELSRLKSTGKLDGWKYFAEELLPELDKKLNDLSR